MTNEEIAWRMGAAVAAGLVLGLDREIRGIAAGMRTHAVVALSAALTTISALQLYESLGPGTSDPLRVVQGLAQAIGFIAAGAIFVSRGDVRNLTSAANLWLAASVGIAFGAGQYVIGGMGAALGVVLIVVVRAVEAKLPKRDVREES